MPPIPTANQLRRAPSQPAVDTDDADDPPAPSSQAPSIPVPAALEPDALDQPLLPADGDGDADAPSASPATPKMADGLRLTTTGPAFSPPVSQNTAQSPTSSSSPSERFGPSAHGSRLKLPVPAPSPADGHTSQASFVLPDDDDAAIALDELPPEVAEADISIASDGSFVETSSPLAARELKRRFDQHFGVSMDRLSPYAITAFTNQHGQQRYRVGARTLSAPAANAEHAEEQLLAQRTKSQPTPVPHSLRDAYSSNHSSTLHLPSTPMHSQSKKGPRSSRLSVHTFFTGFNRSGAHLSSASTSGGGAFTSRPTTSNGLTSASTHASPAKPFAADSGGPRKLRKTRSIPDMASAGVSAGPEEASSSRVYLGPAGGNATSSNGGGGGGGPPAFVGRAHSHTVTGADLSALPRLSASSMERGGNASAASSSGASQQISSLTSSSYALSHVKVDVFAEAMGWVREDGASSASQLTSPAGSQSTSFSSFSAAFGERGSAGSSSSANGRKAKRMTYTHPFGPGVTFDSPSRKDEEDGEDGIRNADADVSGLRLDLDGSEDEHDEGERRHTPLGLTPHHGPGLRLMQSYESGLTATPGDGHTSKLRIAALRKHSADETVAEADGEPVPPSPVAEEMMAETDSPGPGVPPGLYVVSDEDEEPSPAASSPIQEQELELELEQEVPADPETPVLFDPIGEPQETVSLKTRSYTYYNTKVFEVLQRYRGLPALDKLDELGTQTTVIKISLDADDSPSPRNDPRFVIWGEFSPAGRAQEEDGVSASDGSVVSRQRSSKLKGHRIGAGRAAGVAPLVAVDAAEEPAETEHSTVIVAASIERWIAQLTSELNYDELLIFFLTYRAYIRPLELAHLLMCRFHWALERHEGTRDEMVRRIVRLRTFVAIRYWVLTFFDHDFVPNRELRLLFAEWLNTLRKDPIVLKNQDALTIVRKLVKAVQSCKDAHTGASRAGRKSTTEKSRKVDATELVGELQHGGEITETLASLASHKHVDDEGSDVDLDFTPDENSAFEFSANAAARATPGSPPLGAISAASSHRVSTMTTSVLHQPIQMAILQHNLKTSSASESTPFVQTPATLPIHNNPIQRAFVNTIGRLGQWKRVLHSRSTIQAPIGICADVSAFDLEVNETGELLHMRGGLESYLKMIEQQSPVPPAPKPVPPPPPPAAAIPTDDESTLFDGAQSAPRASMATEASVPPPDSLGKISEEAQSNAHESLDAASLEIHRNSMAPSVAETMSSLGEPIPPSFAPSSSRPTYPQPPASWGLDVVSIDDLELSDLSDTSDDEQESDSAPAPQQTLRRAARKLPLRRDFEFVRPESVSSLGIRSHSSMRSSIASSIASETEEPVKPVAQPRLTVAGLQQWQVNAIVDALSDDEEGDIEDALRNLEGQISREVREAKASKVDGWVRQIQERLANGDYRPDSPPRFPTSDGESDDEYGEEQPRADASVSQNGSPVDDRRSTRSSASRRSSTQLSAGAELAADAATPMADQTTHNISVTSSPLSSDKARPAIEDVVPLEILESRIPASQTVIHSSIPSSPPQIPPPQLSKFTAGAPIPNFYRSWVLGYKAAVLVQHLAMIDRELFLAVKIEELISATAATTEAPEEVDILDWGQFLKERTRAKYEGRKGPKTSALVAVRARFDLMAKFVTSEIVLTHPHERLHIYRKFLRVAWKCYELNIHSALVAIIAGLQSAPVQRAMKRHRSRLNMEGRMLHVLVELTDASGDFALLRKRIEHLIDVKALASESQERGSTGGAGGNGNAQTTSSGKALPSDGIPFIGIYLSKLHRYRKLPDHIDPTAPREQVRIDPATGGFEPLAHPEVFSALDPLPPYMQLEPLVNVHKQRLIAGVIKASVSGQHLASRVQYPIDRKIYRECLKIRGFDGDTLQRAFAMYSE